MKVETRVGIFILASIAVVLYLSINIRAIRLDRNLYYTYKAYFDDTGGLTVKAAVKIAGVDVGWVESVDLLDGGKAEILMRVNKSNKLAKNAYAMIHQDGLIGTKTLEIDPGDPSTGLLLPGSTLSMPGKTPASVGELLDQFRGIASTIHDVVASFKSVFASRQGEDNMRQTLTAVAQASDRIADFSVVLQRTMKENEQNINQALNNMKEVASSLKDAIPLVQDDVSRVATTIENNVEKVASDVSSTAASVGGAFNEVESTAIQVRETFKEADEVVEKINTGKGVIGKLINEDETYTDIKKTLRGIKDYIGQTQGVMLNLDMHSEQMTRYTNSKGYFELKIRPADDYFYMIQLVGDERGSFAYRTTHRTYRDANGNELVPANLKVPLETKIEFAQTVEEVIQKKYDVLFGLQFGKRFNRLVFRIGMFENSFGVGCDYYVPLKTDYVHWITTLEAFDFRGVNRFNDKRPHIKWLNKLYFMRNVYTNFGLDDIYSKRNCSFFWGGGIRFSDDDLKYFIGHLPLKK